MNEETKPKREVSLDTRLKMRQSALGKHKYWLGKKRIITQETKDKIRAKLKGRKLTPEHIKNMTEAKRKMFEERKAQLEELKLIKSQQKNDIRQELLSSEETSVTNTQPESNTEVFG